MARRNGTFDAHDTTGGVHLYVSIHVHVCTSSQLIIYRTVDCCDYQK